VLGNASGQIEAVHIGHHGVEKDQIEPLTLARGSIQDGERFGASAYRHAEDLPRRQLLQ
jgi:hypothetical protein